MRFPDIDYNRGGSCVLCSEFAYLQIEGHLRGYLFVFPEDIGDGVGIVEILIKVFLKLFTQILLPCVFWGFSREKGEGFGVCLVEVMRSCFEFGCGEEFLELPGLSDGFEIFIDDGRSYIKGKRQLSFTFAGVSPIEEGNIHKGFVILGAFEESRCFMNVLDRAVVRKYHYVGIDRDKGI